MFTIKTCVEVRCDDRRTDCWEQTHDGGIPHYASQDEAIQTLTDLGWTITRPTPAIAAGTTPAGAGTAGPAADPASRVGSPSAGPPAAVAVCGPCSAIRICAAIGHSFLPPAPCRCEGRIPEHAENGCHDWIDCAMCGHWQPAP